MRAFRTLASLFVSLYAVAGMAATELQFRQTVHITTVAGEAFAEDMAALTGLRGTYAVVAGPQWLSLTERGILFGTPTMENVGLNKLYASVERNGATELFLAEVEVRDANVAPTLQFRAKVGEIFMTRLPEVLGEAGRYSFARLPSWLEGTESGTLVGKPGVDDLGQQEFEIFLENDETSHAFVANIQVEGSAQPYNPVTIKVGQLFSIDLVKSIGLAGKYTVQAPRFLLLSTSGVLSGVPTRADIGYHRIWVEVRKGLSVNNYYLDLVVEN